MTLAATCAIGEMSPSPSYYRGEQFDPDLGLYYLRARYYNPATGRFLSRDPEDGKAIDPKTLHKYLYASGDPVNGWDPTGRANLVQVILVTVEVSVYVAQTACYILGGAIVLLELETWKETGHLIDPGLPVPYALACGIIGLLPT